MELKNKKTGGLATLEVHEGYFTLKTDAGWQDYNSLAELYSEWEDASEEPKWYWYIDDAGVIQIDQVLSSEINMRKSIGNYFNTREKAEKAVEKLKAWKRLKDKGITTYIKKSHKDGDNFVLETIYVKVPGGIMVDRDLELLFSGGE